MARIFFMAFEAAGQYILIKKLRNMGHKLIVTEPRYPGFYDLLKQQVQPPEVVVCDASRLPSQAREACNYIRSLKAYRETPILLYNVRPEDGAKSLEQVPGALLINDDGVEATLEKVLRQATPKPK